ncbi:MAG: hypothetical protein QF707_01755 [Candidatus Poseidoniaceae archaeon]|jgi:hypothetical protein|nr:hypothetical protein [Candidatus Poseidoniaceae archaeon]MDP7203703.1 hypothetical protein [Candidatus Poseidoniaceae archaeon]
MSGAKLTWKGRIEQRIESLLPYRRLLDGPDKPAFDSMMRAIRQRRTSGAMLISEEPLDVMILSITLEAYRRIEDLERRFSKLQAVLMEVEEAHRLT